MDTEKKLGIKKSKAILLFLQMILTSVLLVVSIYLLVFVSMNGLGGWMISSYVFITISIIAVMCYAIVGYKKGEVAYQLAVVPFLVAVFINVLLPNRDQWQIAFLTILFALTFAFLLRQSDKRFTNIIAILMVLISLVFSIYSSITAKIDFLGPISDNWPTYVAMYLSIFVPSIMSATFALTYNVRTHRNAASK